MVRFFNVGFLITVLTLASCRHGMPPWDQKEFDYKDLQTLKEPIAKPVQEDMPPPPKAKIFKKQQLAPVFLKKISISLSENLSLKQMVLLQPTLLPLQSGHIHLNL